MGIAPASARVGFIVVAAALLLFTIRLGAIGLWAPDEPRYGQVAEEMRSMQHGPTGLVLLHLNGEAYTQKPPLFFWIAATLGAPFQRVTEIAARLPSVFAGVALVALILRFGAALLGGPSATLGAALLLTTFPFAQAARRAQLDVLLALFESIALVAFWRVDRGIGRRTTNLLLFHGAIALGLLTKGPVALLVPLLIVVAYLGWEGRPRDLRRLFPLWGPIVALGPVLAWVWVAVALAPAGYFDVAITENLIGRFFSGTSHARPFYYFLYQFPVLLAPWVLWLPAVVWASAGELRESAAPERRRAIRFLVSWIAASLLFFSLSSGKRGIYLLPALPAAALLTGHALRVWTAYARGIPGLFHAVCGVVGLALVGAAGWVAANDPLGNPERSLWVGVLVASLVLAAGSAQAFGSRLRAPLGIRLAIPIAAVFAIELVIFGLALPAIDDEKSPRRIARAAAAIAEKSLSPEGSAPESGRVGLVGDRPLVGGLLYYGAQPVTELRSDAEIETFLSRGGRVVVVQDRKRSRFPALAGSEERFRARSGRRALVVLTPQVRLAE